MLIERQEERCINFCRNIYTVLFERQIGISSFEDSIDVKRGYFAQLKKRGGNPTLRIALKVSDALSIPIDMLCLPSREFNKTFEKFERGE